jgi:hypothetical protein
VRLDDGGSVLETYDFRSRPFFDEFARWVLESLNIRPISGQIRDEMEPFSFVWDGSVFEAASDDKCGCFIRAPLGLEDKLRSLQARLAE